MPYGLLLSENVTFPLTLDGGNEIGALIDPEYLDVTDEEGVLRFRASYRHTFHNARSLEEYLFASWQRQRSAEGIVQISGMTYAEFEKRTRPPTRDYKAYAGKDLLTFRLVANCTFEAYDIDDAMTLLSLHFANDDPACDLWSPNAPLKFTGAMKVEAQSD